MDVWLSFVEDIGLIGAVHYVNPVENLVQGEFSFWGSKINFPT